MSDGLLLTHGASGNARMPFLVALDRAFAVLRLTVRRYDLPYRQARPKGPPRPTEAARDRAGLREAAQSLRGEVDGRVFLGGQSYGGRQASLLAAAEPGLADALLLLAYPLHPPGRPDNLRTAHLSGLRTPAFFVHGSVDPFGTLEELEAARRLIPARTSLLPVEGAGHDLYRRGGRAAVEAIVTAFLAFVGDGRPGGLSS